MNTSCSIQKAKVKKNCHKHMSIDEWKQASCSKAVIFVFRYHSWSSAMAQCGMAYAGKPFYSKNVVILNRTGYLVSNTESWYNVGYIH